MQTLAAFVAQKQPQMRPVSQENFTNIGSGPNLPLGLLFYSKAETEKRMHRNSQPCGLPDPLLFAQHNSKHAGSLGSEGWQLRQSLNTANLSFLRGKKRPVSPTTNPTEKWSSRGGRTGGQSTGTLPVGTWRAPWWRVRTREEATAEDQAALSSPALGPYKPGCAD